MDADLRAQEADLERIRTELVEVRRTRASLEQEIARLAGDRDALARELRGLGEERERLGAPLGGAPQTTPTNR